MSGASEMLDAFDAYLAGAAPNDRDCELARAVAFIRAEVFPKIEAREQSGYIETDNRGPLAALGATAHANAQAKGFYDPPPSIPERLCLIHSEVSEALEAHRDGVDALAIVNGKPEGVPSELADIVIRVVDMAEYLGIDLDEAVRLKMAYNATRPHKHGRKL